MARPRRSRLVLTFILCWALTGIAGAQSPASIDIDNFGVVNPSYFRGAQPEGDDYAALAALGVRTVVNLIGDEDFSAAEQAEVEARGMNYVLIPMTTHEPPTTEQQKRFLSIVNAREHQPVYVHCVGGRHRTGVMTAIYRMTTDGITGKQAFEEMKRFKYGWDFLHPEFKRFIHGFQPDRRAAVAVDAQL